MSLDDEIIENVTIEPVVNPLAIALICVPTCEKSIPVCPLVSLNVNVLALILVLNELLSLLYSLPLNCCNNPTDVETLAVYRFKDALVVSNANNLLLAVVVYVLNILVANLLFILDCKTLLLLFKSVIVAYEPVFDSIPSNLVSNEELSFLY